eukprot:6491073-Amphidinium_carterae.1
MSVPEGVMKRCAHTHISTVLPGREKVGSALGSCARALGRQGWLIPSPPWGVHDVGLLHFCLLSGGDVEHLMRVTLHANAKLMRLASVSAMFSFSPLGCL